MRMMQKRIKAEPYILTAYERITNKGGYATVYIEGDGQTWVTPFIPSKYPNPINPVSLHMATRDLSDNVIYLARPCQYNQLPKDVCSDPSHWTESRYSKSAINSIQRALNNIKKRNKLKGFHIVGWGGGGSVAIIVSARRNDVMSLRTVAAVFDHESLTRALKTHPYKNSLNPVDFAFMLSDVPQHHFIGKQDTIISSGFYHKYRERVGSSSCVRYSIIDNAAHELGWVNKWDHLLDFPIDCQSTL
jgi:hypothetical protein